MQLNAQRDRATNESRLGGRRSTKLAAIMEEIYLCLDQPHNLMLLQTSSLLFRSVWDPGNSCLGATLVPLVLCRGDVYATGGYHLAAPVACSSCTSRATSKKPLRRLPVGSWSLSIGAKHGVKEHKPHNYRRKTAIGIN